MWTVGSAPFSFTHRRMKSSPAIIQLSRPLISLVSSQKARRTRLRASRSAREHALTSSFVVAASQAASRSGRPASKAIKAAAVFLNSFGMTAGLLCFNLIEHLTDPGNGLESADLGLRREGDEVPLEKRQESHRRLVDDGLVSGREQLLALRLEVPFCLITREDLEPVRVVVAVGKP